MPQLVSPREPLGLCSLHTCCQEAPEQLVGRGHSSERERARQGGTNIYPAPHFFSYCIPIVPFTSAPCQH